MPLFRINPIHDERWSVLVAEHPSASVFHTVGWLQALQHTYGYEPRVYTTSAPGEGLRDGMVFCEVRSFLTGRRLVSLPFSDHCSPLVRSDVGLNPLLEGPRTELIQDRWKYFEFRPLQQFSDGAVSRLEPHRRFAMHVIDLRPTAEQLLRTMHKTSIRDMIRRGEREGVSCIQGRSEAALSSFYDLLLITRRRHGIPPQPSTWFQNLVRFMDENLDIWVASKDGKAIASIINLSFGRTAVNKYACSDARFHKLGAVPLLHWHAIQEAKSKGMMEYDLGRSDLDNPGLIDFKERLGGQRSELSYYRFPHHKKSSTSPFAHRAVEKMVSTLPDAFVRSLGRILYRHMG